MRLLSHIILENEILVFVARVRGPNHLNPFPSSPPWSLLLLIPTSDNLLASQCLHISTQENSFKPYKGQRELVMIRQAHPKE